MCYLKLKLYDKALPAFEKAMEDNNIKVSGTLFSSAIVPENAQILAQIENPISPVLPKILKNSNNLFSETLFKLAGAKKYSATGTSAHSINVFKEFYKDIGISTEKIMIKDGSGVSRNNLVYVDWITKTLNKIYKEKNFEAFKNQMAQAGDGTLSNRLFDLRGDAWFKTGSLSNISAIAGFINSQDGNTYSFAIVIQNFLEEQPKAKKFEDEIIKYIYSR